MRTVTIHRIFFLEDDVVDGDFPRDDVDTEVIEVDDVEEAAQLISREGLSFEATGNDWAANPDGSRIIDYGAGRREEVTAHPNGFTADELDALMSAVG